MWICSIGAVLGLGWLLTRRMAWTAERSVPPLASGVMPAPVHVHDTGPLDGVPLVLIHGLYGQMQHFTYGMAGPLAERYRVILIDRPGCGYSPRDGALTPKEQAAQIWQALDARQIHNPILVGHSLGGAVAVEMALLRPESARALALIAPAVLPVAPVGTWLPRLLRRALAPVLWLATHTLAAPVVWVLQSLIRRRVFAPEPIAKDYMTRGGAALGLRPVTLRSAVEDVLTLAETAPDRASRVQGLRVNGALIFGEADRIVPPALEIALWVDKGWDVTILPDRSHMIPLTAPAQCIATIDRLCDRTADFDLDPTG